MGIKNDVQAIIDTIQYLQGSLEDAESRAEEYLSALQDISEAASASYDEGKHEDALDACNHIATVALRGVDIDW